VSRSKSGRLRELVELFGTLGFIGFGGPAAHVALMRREVVERRGWMTDAEVVDLVGVTSLIPGPNSTELAMLVGPRRAGRLGLLVAGAAFIVPAATIVLGLAGPTSPMAPPWRARPSCTGSRRSSSQSWSQR
jgi:chromate transporter